jgi:hypothetical protein
MENPTQNGRIVYENEATLLTERLAITEVAALWTVSVVKLPRKYSADFALIREGCGERKVVAWAEFKSRTNPIDKYKNYQVSLHKYMRMTALATETGIMSLLIVQWTDCTGYIQLPTPVNVVFGGTMNRGDWEDKEPMVEIPNSMFKIISRK